MSSISGGGTSGANINDIPDDVRRAAQNPASDVTLPGGNAGEDEPLELVEIVTVSATGEPAGIGGLEGSPLAEITDGGGFRWWYVPLAVAPVAAGATVAAVLIARRNRQQAPAEILRSFSKQGRDWIDALQESDTTRRATKTFQRGMAIVRENAGGLPDQVGTWRDSATGALTGLAGTATMQKMTDSARDTLDSVTSRFGGRTPILRRAAKRRPSGMMGVATDTRDRVAGWIAGMTAGNVAASATDKAKAKAQATAMRARVQALRAREKAKPTTGTSPQRALFRPASRAATTTSNALQRTGKSVSNGWKRVRAFTFGMFVSAMLTYIRGWRMRMNQKDMRETASGRLAPAEPPQQFQRA